MLKYQKFSVEEQELPAYCTTNMGITQAKVQQGKFIAATEKQ